MRILGIDTPETKKPGYTVGCWGPEATEFAKSTMVGQRVALVTDATQDHTDRYGRTLVYLVRADGWDYSVEAARAGAAKSYVYGGVPVSRYDAIAAAENEAKDAWAVGSAVQRRHGVDSDHRICSATACVTGSRPSAATCVLRNHQLPLQPLCLRHLRRAPTTAIALPRVRPASPPFESANRAIA